MDPECGEHIPRILIVTLRPKLACFSERTFRKMLEQLGLHVTNDTVSTARTRLDVDDGRGPGVVWNGSKRLGGARGSRTRIFGRSMLFGLMHVAKENA